jgi:hypothetical protein
LKEDAAFRYLIGLLDSLGIGYFIGGSVASSIHGTPRATMDVDVVAAISQEQVKRLVEGLRAEFYVDEDTVREALLRGRAFNIIHLVSAYKFDLFPLRGENEFEQQEFARRLTVRVAPFGGDPVPFHVATAEDTLLAKLDWFRQGGGTSEKQWNDMLGIVRTQGERLDKEHLRFWAKRLRLEEVLDRLLGQ